MTGSKAQERGALSLLSPQHRTNAGKPSRSEILHPTTCLPGGGRRRRHPSGTSHPSCGGGQQPRTLVLAQTEMENTRGAEPRYPGYMTETYIRSRLIFAFTFGRAKCEDYSIVRSPAAIRWPSYPKDSPMLRPALRALKKFRAKRRQLLSRTSLSSCTQTSGF